MNATLRRLGLGLAIALSGALTGVAAPVPWTNGETLTYTINWGVIPAAEGTFTVRETDDHWEFRLHLVSKGPVDAFYPIDSWCWSFVQKEPWRSLEYGEDRSEGSKRIRERTRVDYTAHSFVREKWSKGQTDQLTFTVNALDDVGSMLYALRAGSWKPGDKRQITVCESSKIKTGEALCRSIEKRALAGRPMQELIQLYCEPTGETKLKQKGKFTLWMTNDARRLPLVATLEFKYGTFEITLINPPASSAANRPSDPALNRTFPSLMRINGNKAGEDRLAGFWP